MKPSYPTVTILAAAVALVIPSYGADVTGGGGKAGELKPANRKPDQPPKDTPDAAAKNLTKAKVLAGFTADLWASEPLLANPVAFCFDPRGRMFVSETHRYRSSVLDIRHYMFMLEDDLATRNQDDWLASIKKNFPKDWQNLGKETEIVRLVEDSNGDGKADKSSVYADGFNSLLDGIASGVLWHNNALYFTNIPALWKLSGEDKAEKREEMFRGFGIRFSYTGHDFHGLAAGPDGRLYFSIGDRAASVKTKEGGHVELPDEGGVFRCEPDGSHLELVMRGLRNPQELAFDDYGNLFTGDNDSDQGDRERWVYIVEGADAGWRIGWQHHPLGSQFNPWLAEKMWEPRDAKKNQPAYIVSPIANLPDGPSGLAYNPGTGLPAEFKGSFFLAGFKGSTAKSAVSTFKSTPSGATFKLEGMRTFLDNVQATDVAFGPDSRIYVSAWDEGWERSDQGRIIRLSNEAARKEQAAQIAEVQKLLADGFAQRSPAELVKLLGHADQRVRLEAQWALAAQAEAKPSAASLIVGAMTDTKLPTLVRMHAIWAWGQVGRAALNKSPKADPPLVLPLPADAKMRALFDDADAEVRGQFLKTMADSPAGFGSEVRQAYVKKLTDPAPRVRFFAAMALAKKGSLTAVAPIVQMLKENDGKDEYLQHAGIVALARCASSDALQTVVKDPSRSVRLAAMLAAGKKVEARQRGRDSQAGNPDNSLEVIATTAPANSAIVPRNTPRVDVFAAALADADASIVTDTARVIVDSDVSTSYPALAALVAKADGTPMPTDNAPLAIRALNANFRVGDADSAKRIVAFVAGASHEPLRLAALEMVEHWGNPPARDYVVGIYRPLPKRDAAVAVAPLVAAAPKLLADRSEKIVVAVCNALEGIGAKTAGPDLLALVKNTSAPVKARLAAIDALSNLGTPELAAALTAAAADANPALKTEASKLLGKTDPASSAKQLAASFGGAGVPQKKQILTALGDNPSAEAGKILAGLVADFAKVPAEAQLELLDAAAKRPEAKDAVAKYEASLPANDALAKYLPTLVGGDAAAGEKIFKEHAVAACMRCHKVANTGGDAGPALDGIATRKDRRYVLESIVNVNAAIADGFQMVVLSMKDGSVAAGFLKKETETELTVQTPGEAQAKVYKKADIKQRDTAPSGMLPNIADLITKRELRDIVEYCATLK